MQVDYEMHTLTADTGGRIVEASEAENLDAAYRSIARELGHQYSIGYIPSTSSTPARHSRFQPVSVVVPGRSVVVRARRGYIARER